MDFASLLPNDLNALDNLHSELKNLENTVQATVDEKTNNASLGSVVTHSTPKVVVEPVRSEATSEIIKINPLPSFPSGSHNTDGTVKVAHKRQILPSASSAPMVTKVIITKNPNTSQPQAIPVQIGHIQGQTITLTTMAPGISVPQMQAQGSPTKTITISQQGIVSPSKQIIIPGTPTKMPISKLPMSPQKTPTKITMIPVPVTKSPQRIAPATVAVSMLPKALTVGSVQTMTVTNASTELKPTTITMSPSKVIKQQTVLVCIVNVLLV